jgi:O-antigen ligase
LERALLVLICCVFLSLTAVIDWEAAIPKLLGICLGVVIAWAISSLAPARLGTLRWLSTGVALVGGLIAAIGLIAIDWHTDRGFLLAPITNVLPRLIHGVSVGTNTGGVHPNEAAGVLDLCIPIALSLVTVASPTQGKLIRSLLLASSVLMIFVLLLTQSRSGIIGGLVGIAILIAGHRQQRGRMRIVTFFFIMTALTFILPIFAVVASMQTRTELWSRALALILTFPITGIGPGQLPIVLDRWYFPVYAEGETFIIHAHNLFLQLAVEHGVIAAGCVMWMLAVIAIAAVRAYRRGRTLADSSLALGLLAALAAYCTFGLTDAIAFGARGGMLFWVVLGLGGILIRLEAQEGEDERPDAPNSIIVQAPDPTIVTTAHRG